MRAHRALQGFPAGRQPIPTGCLWFEEQGQALDEMARRLGSLGYRVERLDRNDIAGKLPALGPVPDEALFFPDEDATDPAELARGLIAASGARLVQARVLALSEAQGRVTGVMTDQGRIIADQVVLATGIGTPELLKPLGLELPMLTRPGMIVSTTPVPPVCSVILATPGQEVRQNRAGRLLAPASAGHQSDSAESLGATAELVDATLVRLRGLFPQAEIALGTQVSALRPVPGDGLPVAGPSRMPGLWIAVMHSGATLAPGVSSLLAAEMKSGLESTLLAPFRPARFGL